MVPYVWFLSNAYILYYSHNNATAEQMYPVSSCFVNTFQK